jgi:hypothetical protein
MAHNVALYRGGGSIAIVGAARSGIIVGRHPTDIGVRVIASNKSNLGPTPKSLTFSLESAGDVARIAWGQECDLTANDIMAHSVGKQSAGEQAAEAIRELLAAGALPSNELDAAVKTMGYGAHAIKAGRSAAGVKASKEGFSGGWILQLPGVGDSVESGGHQDRSPDEDVGPPPGQ